MQILLEGLLVAVAGAVFGLMLALASEGLINRFFQWKYDTALLFVGITPRVALHLRLDCRAARRRGDGGRLVGAAPTQRAAGWYADETAALRLRAAWSVSPRERMLGILGVTAVGALLFDMLLLSQGMIVSMRDLLDRTGYDVRVTTTAELPRTAPRVKDAAGTVDGDSPAARRPDGHRIRFADVVAERGEGEPLTAPSRASSERHIRGPSCGADIGTTSDTQCGES